ncbi:hypothetical protein D3C75_1117890 [compost metagenome]
MRRQGLSVRDEKCKDGSQVVVSDHVYGNALLSLLDLFEPLEILPAQQCTSLDDLGLCIFLQRGTFAMHGPVYRRQASVDVIGHAYLFIKRINMCLPLAKICR